jgi:hypothetical protein
MTYPTREHEELLRRALRVAADSVEPAGDGLERIRARLTTPRPAVAAWMMSGTEPAVLRLRPLLTRLRPLLTRLRQVTESALDRRWAGRGALRLWAGRGALRLWAGRGALRLWAGRGALRLWAGRGALRLWASRGALRTHPAWLRPAAAMAAFVVIIGSGALAIRALQHTIRQTGVPTSLGVPEGTSSGQSGRGLNSKGHKVLSPVPPVPLVAPSLPEFWPLRTTTGTPPPRTSQPTPLASPSCTPTVTQSRSPTPSPPTSPSVSPSPPPSGSPSPTPPATGSPTPTVSPTDSPAASSAGAVTQAVAAAPLSTGAGSTSGSPAPGVQTGTC